MEKFYGKVIYLYFPFFLLIFFGCQKQPMNPGDAANVRNPLPVDTANPLPVDTAFDSNAGNLARAVYQSLGESDFCLVLKDELMKKADGDYDVILKHFLPAMVAKTNNTAIMACVGANRTALKSGSVETELLNKYPRMQITMPVNAEKWDGKSKVHVVALPSNFQEGITKEVEAIAPDGSKVMLSTEKEPDFPVIVICENERSNKNGYILPAFNNTKPDPNFDPSIILKSGTGGFTGTAATSYPSSTAISFSTVFSIPETMYNYSWKVAVYRDDLSGTGYQKVAEFNSMYSGGLIYAYYNDVYTLPGRSYSYYAAAQFSPYPNVLVDFQRSPTVSATIPTPPSFVSDFSVKCTSATTMDLNWTNINYSNWNTLKLERQTNYDATWRLVSDLPITTINYQHQLGYPNPPCNIKYTYRLTVSNTNNQTSQSLRCAEYLANRRSGQTTVITRLACDSYSVMRDMYESWLRGAPEWDIVVVGINPVTKLPGNITDLYWQGESSCCQDLQLPITTQWEAERDGYVYSYNLREVDGGGGKLTIGCKLAAKVKLFDIIDFGPELTVNYETNIGSTDDQAGTAYYYYYNDANGYDLRFNRVSVTVKAAN